MAYFIEVDEITVLPYLNEHFSPSDCEKVLDFLDSLGNTGESHWNDRRYAPGSPMIVFDHVFVGSSDKGCHLRFIVIDSAAAEYGVLRVRFVDEY